MSCTASSGLILGAEIKVRAEQYQTAITRYDPKTGEPSESTATRVRVWLVVAGATIAMPDDETTHDEFKANNPNMASWKWPGTHVDDIVAEYLESRGFKLDSSYVVGPDDVAAFDHHGRWFVGRRLAAGGVGDKSVVVVDASACTAAAADATWQVCRERLGLDGEASVALILLTEMS